MLIASSSPPTRSIFSGSAVRSRDGRLKWIIAIAASASGTLIQNTSCQRPRQPDDEDSVQRAEHAAQLLRGADAPEYPGAVPLGPQVCTQRERHRQQCTAGHALDGAPDHQHMQIGGQCGDHRARDEGAQADLQQQFAAEPVRGPAQAAASRRCSPAGTRWTIGVIVGGD